MNTAPIVLFIYNRPHYLAQTIKSLSKNSLFAQSDLIIFADGKREDAGEEEIALIEATRKTAKEISGAKSIRITEREKNLGLANSVISGVSEVLQEFSKVIVLEDDLELSPFFLEFMNDSLSVYENDDKVLSVGACNYFANSDIVPETFFYPVPDCWGWATWQDRWQLFEPDGTLLQKKLEEHNLLNEFNLHGAFNFSRLLQSYVDGKVSSWSVRWHAVAVLNEKLSLYPKCSVSKHIGIEKNATHKHDGNYENLMIFPKEKIRVERQEVQMLPEVYEELRQTFIRLHETPSAKVSFIQKVKNTIRPFIPSALIFWHKKSKL
jgi:glycosyltransferase involved in cell wall biosynthesis